MFQRNEGTPHLPPIRPTQVEARVPTPHSLPAHDARPAPASKADDMIALLNERVRQGSRR